MVSAEGLGLFGDAKSNAVGFAVLNMISKGSFTLSMLKIGADHRRRWPDLAPANKRSQSWLVEKLQCYESVNSNGKEQKQLSAEEKKTTDEDDELKGTDLERKLQRPMEGVESLWV